MSSSPSSTMENHSHKRSHTPCDCYHSLHERKKYLTEAVIHDMAAMSLNSTLENKGLSLDRVGWTRPVEGSMEGSSAMPMEMPLEMPLEMPRPLKHTVSLHDMDGFLHQQSLSEDEYDFDIDLDEKTFVETHVNGSLLLMEMRPGEKRYRIPDFVLYPSTESKETQRIAEHLQKTNAVEECLPESSSFTLGPQSPYREDSEAKTVMDIDE
ncbi:hypothetical protein BDF14DRAFT_611697 [Spinellus fusiger]|nr:hypothetical protein BDF14DRAFT_611697 [Spinellus fusiger]